jgi:hypothetical protein
MIPDSSNHISFQLSWPHQQPCQCPPFFLTSQLVNMGMLIAKGQLFNKVCVTFAVDLWFKQLKLGGVPTGESCDIHAIPNYQACNNKYTVLILDVGQILYVTLVASSMHERTDREEEVSPQRQREKSNTPKS